MESLLSASCSSQFNTGDRRRGESYLAESRVRLVFVGTLGVKGIAEGSLGEQYEVYLDLSDIKHYELGVSCQCMRFEGGENCKHLWAVIRKVDQYYDVRLPRKSELYLSECDPEAVAEGTPIVHRNHLQKRPAVQKPVSAPEVPAWKSALAKVRKHLGASAYDREVSSTSLVQLPQYWFAIALPDTVDSGYLPIQVFQSKPRKGGEWSVATKISLNSHESRLIADVQTRRVMSLLERPEVEYYNYRYGNYSSKLQLREELLDETLQELCSSGRFVWMLAAGHSLEDYRHLTYDEGGCWNFVLAIEPSSKSTKAEQDLQVVPMLRRLDEAGQEQTRPIDEVVAVCESGAVLFEGQVATVRSSDIGWVRGWQRNAAFDLPRKEFGALLHELHSVASPPDLVIDESLGVERLQVKPTCRLQLKSPEAEREKYLQANVFFRYGETLVPATEPRAAVWDAEGNQILTRDFEAEAESMSLLTQFPFQEVRYRRDDGELGIHRKWFNDLVRLLSEKGWEVLADGKLFRRAGNFDIKVESGEDWFDLHAQFDFEGVSSSLPTLLAALKRGDKHIVLDDGTHGLLPEEWLQRFAGLSSVGEVDGDSVRFKSNQALMLDMLLAEQENVSIDRSFSSWCTKLKGFSGVKPAKQPRGFQGEMREYQLEGLGWFKFLNEFKFGGCLADDMGLGKTIQVLALLENRRSRRLKSNESRKPSLAIVPKSLVFNWVEEAARFAPKLRVLDYTGLQRGERLEQMAESDLVVTTYATFRRDVETLKDVEFDYAILDEAQAIKNPSAQASKAVRLIKSDHRLAMTGTPVENHLGDLWSLFDFLNPGMLGNSTASTFTVSTDEGKGRLTALSNALRPFILRRTKEQVLTELPEKTEQTLHCEMSPKQKKLYNELRDHYRRSLSKKVEEVGLKRSKIHVLEALLRLRQAACDPRLVDPKQKVSGAKIELLMQQLDEVLSEGHKVLVFSQFTSLLSLVRNELTSRGWEYEYLDGKSRQRAASVKRFQEDANCPLFLISLKAGGHGLNLTAADYVFILDPWWNPAAEAQAIDRAHRMGQQKPVVAYRMIAKGTVEDKIVQLQTSKRELADAIINADQSLIRGLTLEDLHVLFE